MDANSLHSKRRICSPFSARCTLMQRNLSDWLLKSTEHLYIQLVECEETIAAWNEHFIGAYSKFGPATYIFCCHWKNVVKTRWWEVDLSRTTSGLLTSLRLTKSPELIRTPWLALSIVRSCWPFLHWLNHTRTRFCQLQICETLAVCTKLLVGRWYITVNWPWEKTKQEKEKKISNNNTGFELSGCLRLIDYVSLHPNLLLLFDTRCRVGSSLLGPSPLTADGIGT